VPVVPGRTEDSLLPTACPSQQQGNPPCTHASFQKLQDSAMYTKYQELNVQVG
jgi:hypothetical protein